MRSSFSGGGEAVGVVRQRGQQGRFRNRFAEVTIAPSVQALLPIFWEGIRRQGDDQSGRTVVLLFPLTMGQAAEVYGIHTSTLYASTSGCEPLYYVSATLDSNLRRDTGTA